jgi:hypothetical protein
VEDVDGLEGHLLETGEVRGCGLLARGVVGEFLEVVLVDVTVEPDGQVGRGEDTEARAVLLWETE